MKTTTPRELGGKAFDLEATTIQVATKETTRIRRRTQRRRRHSTPSSPSVEQDLAGAFEEASLAPLRGNKTMAEGTRVCSARRAHAGSCMRQRHEYSLPTRDLGPITSCGGRQLC